MEYNKTTKKVFVVFVCFRNIFLVKFMIHSVDLFHATFCFYSICGLFHSRVV